MQLQRSGNNRRDGSPRSLQQHRILEIMVLFFLNFYSGGPMVCGCPPSLSLSLSFLTHRQATVNDRWIEADGQSLLAARTEPEIHTQKLLLVHDDDDRWSSAKKKTTFLNNV